MIGDTFSIELADELLHPDSKPAESVRRILSRWRRFWGQLPRMLLSREEILGLFAELWFLSVWLLPAIGQAEAMRRWRGPFGARHDFEWPGKSVEVKATTSSRGLVHRINGIEQLSPPEQGELFLFSLHLREEAGATNSLPVLVASILTRLNSDVDALNRFETALAQVGYSQAHDEEYSKIHLRIVGEGLFAVRDDFPHLTPENFVNGVPAGIERMEYEINLNTFDHLRVARIPSEAVIHVQ